MKKKLTILTLSMMILLTAGCGKVPKLANGEEVVAEIEGKQFTADELYKELKAQGGTSVLLSLIDKYITSQEYTDDAAADSYVKAQQEQYSQLAEIQGTDLETAVLQSGYQSLDAFLDVIRQNYISTKVAEKYIGETLTDKEIEKYYNDEIFGAMTVRHILIIPEESSSGNEDKTALKEAAFNKTMDLIKQLNDGADFETLAKENSQDSTASNGGLYENFLKENTDAAFWKAAYDLKDGEYTKAPVESQYGYHIILKVSSQEKPSLDDSREKIIENLVAEKIAADDSLIAKTWADIREKYKLNIVETTIKDNYNSSVNALKNA